MPGVGEDCPDFALSDQNGSAWTLKGIKESGKRTLMYWYPKADTPDCTVEAQGFQAYLPHFEEKGVQVLGASTDSHNVNKAFAAKFSITFPLLSDQMVKFPKAMGFEPTRWAILISADGKLEKVWPAVDAASFPQAVLAEL
mmetsp:Transcript_59040/g.141015  ORF Transcript_59040/g.141015 Transcript_59040/m.141015 type:complete len:141 (+) Transcript_59040:113-535(+)